MIGLDALDKLEDHVRNKRPNELQSILYLFWEKGISLNEFNELPIPYILTILNVHGYIKKEEEKAYKKANRKK